MKDKTILITGGTGSLGQQLVRNILPLKPKAIRIYSRGEYMQSKMAEEFNNPLLRFLIGDVRDKDRLYRAMNGVDIVIHTAALKRVEVCEANPIEAKKTNIDGSENVIDAAIDNQVEKVLAISSDKAVHPINVYGSTKQQMEKLIIGGNIYGKTRFSCVRSGNFEVSKGNVIDTWLRQLETGDEITVTDIEMTRYWISLREISHFVIWCLSIMAGGEIFIPKMKQTELSEIIHNFNPDAKIKITGRRVGEKLHELLFNEGEQPIEKENYYLIRG